MSRGGSRPGAGRKKSGNPRPASGSGRGGARPGAGRKPKFFGIAPGALIADIEAEHGVGMIDGLFTEARSGSIEALRAIDGIFALAADRIVAPPEARPSPQAKAKVDEIADIFSANPTSLTPFAYILGAFKQGIQSRIAEIYASIWPSRRK